MGDESEGKKSDSVRRANDNDIVHCPHAKVRAEAIEQIETGACSITRNCGLRTEEEGEGERAR